MNPEQLPVIEFDFAFATDTRGGPRMSMMIATDSIHGSVVVVVAKIKGARMIT